MTRPLATLDPLLSLGGIRHGPACPSILDLPHVEIVSRGRAAIALALEASRIGTGATVLMPAFNCPAMTAGVRAAGAEPRFFAIKENLSIDPDAVLRAADASTRAVLIPHFFAWRQPCSLFASLAQNTPWLLIEDCAHSFFGVSGGQAPGNAGHYSVASVAKFFPSRWGGVIASATRELPLQLAQPSSLHQLKLAANATEEAARFGRLGVASAGVRFALDAVTTLRRIGKPRDRGPAPALAAGVDKSYAEVDIARLHEHGGWWVTRQIADRSGFAQRAARRLEIYRRLRGALGQLKFASLLLPERDPDFPPYVFPLLLSDPARHFQALRARGVPLFRWEDSIAGTCEITDRYRLSLVQLPCHDTLTDAEVAAIEKAVRETVG